MLKITNTLTGKKETFISLEKNYVKMYACGITVSGNAHIGHAVQAIIFDIIRKYLEKIGYQVTYARNYTDVDDKIIANALKLGVDPMEFAKINMAKIEQDLKDLKVDKPTLTLKATDNINNIIEFISKLIALGYAYPTENGDVYFSVEKDIEYGKLSHRNLEDAINGVRKENEENKNNPLDFALWKSAKPNEIYWQSPWGNGRPGWHIECSAMNYYHLGEQIDIHGGGRDLIFPHHENEIAQTECLTKKQFAKYWIHNGLVKVNGQKMSKSLNNSILIRDLLDKYDAEIIKFALLQTNYKNDINITNDLFEESRKHLVNFYTIGNEIVKKYGVDATINKNIDKEFNEAMDDDFNTAKAIANLFGYFKSINLKLNNNDSSCLCDWNAIKHTYSLLGLFENDADTFISQYKDNFQSNEEIPDEIIDLAKKRWNAKQSKNFALADLIRKEISDKGYTLLDKQDAYIIEKIKSN